MPLTREPSQVPNKNSIAFLLSDFEQYDFDEESSQSIAFNNVKMDVDQCQITMGRKSVVNTSRRLSKRNRKPTVSNRTITRSLDTIHPENKSTRLHSLRQRGEFCAAKKVRVKSSSGTCTEVMGSRILQSVFTVDDNVSDSNWLSSPLIDLVLWQLASRYPDVQFLSTDFSHFYLESVLQRHITKKSRQKSLTRDDFRITDVLGCTVEYLSHHRNQRPLVFIANVNLIHWNLFRVQFTPEPELQLFEPMGRLSSRTGLSNRAIPRGITLWLDTCFPLSNKSWRTCAVSAITTRQQVSGFDCGVACLLYAEKCGQGLAHDKIHKETSQHTITAFRTTLRQWVKTIEIE